MVNGKLLMMNGGLLVKGILRSAKKLIFLAFSHSLGCINKFLQLSSLHKVDLLAIPGSYSRAEPPGYAELCQIILYD